MTHNNSHLHVVLLSTAVLMAFQYSTVYNIALYYICISSSRNSHCQAKSPTSALFLPHSTPELQRFVNYSINFLNNSLIVSVIFFWGKKKCQKFDRSVLSNVRICHLFPLVYTTTINIQKKCNDIALCYKKFWWVLTIFWRFIDQTIIRSTENKWQTNKIMTCCCSASHKFKDPSTELQLSENVNFPAILTQGDDE